MGFIIRLGEFIKSKFFLSRRMGKLVIYTCSVLLVVVSYALFLIWKTWPINSWSISNAGVFGDSFGVITCLFTAFAFIGVIVNIDMQREDIARQQRNLEHQNFEGNFFQMLNHLDEIIKELSVDIKDTNTYKTKTTIGRAAFNVILKSLKEDFKFNEIVIEEDSKREVYFSSKYDWFWNAHGANLGHYFRWLYHLMAFVDKSEVDDKEFYFKLIGAKLSTQELVLLFYNSSFIRGGNFKPLLIKYDVMSNVEVKDLANSSHRHLIQHVRFWGDYKL